MDRDRPKGHNHRQPLPQTQEDCRRSAVSDKALVLNTLRGLKKRFSSTAQLIPLLDPFPSFLHTRSILAMAETKAAMGPLWRPARRCCSPPPEPRPAPTLTAASPQEGGKGGTNPPTSRVAMGTRTPAATSASTRARKPLEMGRCFASTHGADRHPTGHPTWGAPSAMAWSAFLGLDPGRLRPTWQEVSLCCLRRSPPNLYRRIGTYWLRRSNIRHVYVAVRWPRW